MDKRRMSPMKLIITLVLTAAQLTVMAEATKEFPRHWGEPPAIQTRDYVELPAGYGHGSSTLAKWITDNLERDLKSAEKAGSQGATLLYENNFEKGKVGELPEDFMVLNGDFTVKEESGNKFVELPGAPLDSFVVQFGPAQKESVTVGAKILATAKGRRMPSFGVGLGGVTGWKLMVAPAKDAVELLRDTDVKASAPLEWKSGEWTQVRLQIRKSGNAEWTIAGKVWQGSSEPAVWQISAKVSDEPPSGRASFLGSPYSGTPIRFDDLRLEKAPSN